MEWLNYHHLFYFWTVVRTGSITKACEELRLAPPTVSAQLKSFEDQLGEKLLKRSGRNLVPTEIGPGPFGAKAVGETINAGVHPAIANAVRDAVGVRIKTFPVTSERVYEALQQRGSLG